MSTLWRVIADPIRGVTPFWRVVVLYSVVGGGVLALVLRALSPTSAGAVRLFGLFALLYSAYVTLAIYRCAGSCGSAPLARLVRIGAVLSLLMLPIIGYLIVTDHVAFAT